VSQPDPTAAPKSEERDAKSQTASRFLASPRLRVLVALILLAIGAAALAQSWARWLDPIIDVGRDLYIPGELLQGRKLYRDLLYFYPPLTPYLLAGLNLIFGRSLLGYTAIGVLISLAVVWQLWRIGRRMGGWEVGAVATFLFLTFSFTGASTWGCNFLFPYAHAATIGTALVLCFLASLLSEPGGRGPEVWLAVLFGLLAAWTKIEFALLVAVVFTVVAARSRFPPRVWLGTVAAAAASFALVSIAFRDAPAGQHWLRDQVLAPSLLQKATAHRFYALVGGAADLPGNLVEVLLSAILVSALVGALVLLDRRAPAGRLRLAWELLFVVVAFAGLSAIADHALFRSWALFQFALLPWAWRERERPLLILLLVSILSTWRILLRLSPDWYGFFLAVPAYLALPYVLMRYLPSRRLYSVRAGLAWIPVFLFLGLSSLVQQRHSFELKHFLVTTPRGNFFDANPDRAAILTDAIRFLRRGELETLVVMPEGLTLNYFTDLRNPTGFHTFTPAELDTTTERRAIAALERNPPGVVVLLSRDVSEFGFRGFGLDYGKELLAYLHRNYTPARRWQSPRFQLLVLRAK